MNKNVVKSSNLWYKEPWPWVIIIMMIFIVVSLLILFWVSLNISNDLVSDNYYQEGKNIFKQLDKENKAKELNISAKLFIQDNMQEVKLIMQGNYNKNSKLKLQFIHPLSKNKDMQILLTQHHVDKNIFYIGKLSNRLLVLNHWYISLYDTNNNWVIRGKWIISQGNVVLLHPNN